MLREVLRAARPAIIATDPFDSGEGCGAMHDTIQAFADVSIRRACGFAGLGIGFTMLGLAFDPVLALRIGGDLLALVCGVLLLAAWWAPYRDLRRAEVWHLMPPGARDALRSRPRAEWHALVAGVLRSRMVWHAERVGLAAVSMWALSWGWHIAH